ncbi:MAG TPA: hypothetical protein VHU83_20685 [Bryobacteraceae bacterium]|jgi:hypothetical protein|nr:hypothetical protein [Bryobacteraceae bacterium]
MHALPARAFGSILIALALVSGNLFADPIPVRHPQGSSHGFLALKTPPDYHIWILPGTSPAFIREIGPLYEGGPIWQIEQISPEFTR